MNSNYDVKIDNPIEKFDNITRLDNGDLIIKNDVRLITSYNNFFGNIGGNYEKSSFHKKKILYMMNDAYKNNSNIYVLDVPSGNLHKNVYIIIEEDNNNWYLGNRESKYII